MPVSHAIKGAADSGRPRHSVIYSKIILIGLLQNPGKTLY